MSEVSQTAPLDLTMLFKKEQSGWSVVAKAPKDKLSLYVDITKTSPETTNTLNRDELLSALGQVPPMLLQLDVIEKLLAKLAGGEEVTQQNVATAEAPLDGRDGKVLLLVKQYVNPQREELITFVDPHFFHTFDNVEVGNVVVRIYPPRPSKDGIDILGKPLKAYVGKPAKFKFDPQTIALDPATEDKPFDSLVAKQVGYLTEEKGQWTIKSELVLPGVDLKSGDVEFVGSVKIQGDVKKDFRVHARGDITVMGTVYQGILQSDAGSVRVKGSVLGYGTGGMGIAATDKEKHEEKADAGNVQVRSSGVFAAALVDGVNAESDGDIEIEKEARNSLLRTKAICQMPQGHLVGGEVYSVCGVEAKEIGGHLGAATRIVLCSDIESSAEYAMLTSQIHQHESAEELIRLQLGYYADDPIRLKHLVKPVRQKMELILSKLHELKNSRHAIERQRATLLESAMQNTTFRINFLGNIHAGVRIEAGDANYIVPEDRKGPGTVEFDPVKKTFEVSELRPIVCTVKDKTKLKQENASA